MKQRSAAENKRLKGGLRKIKSAPRSEIFIVLDNIKSMENVGAIFRTADAIRAKKIYLCGITATPPRNKIFKTSMGAVEWVDWEYHENVSELVSKLKKENSYFFYFWFALFFNQFFCCFCGYIITSSFPQKSSPKTNSHQLQKESKTHLVYQ